METFELTFDHIKLIRRMYVGWQDCETGAPEIDPKRPYGNSDVAGDVFKILGWRVPDDRDWRESDAGEAAEERALKLHRETEVALQIVLLHGFDAVGSYCRRDPWLPWERAL